MGNHIEPNDEIKNSCKNIVLDYNKLKRVMHIFLSELEKGLTSEYLVDSVVNAHITFLQGLPTLSDHGDFLVIDFGGVTFRILYIELSTNCTINTESQTFSVPDNILISTGNALFEYIAQCLWNFMNEKHLLFMSLPLALTFGFPYIQLGLTKGILHSWSKGFKCRGIIGDDVVALLNDAIKRRGDIHVKICAILNDTTGTLMLSAWENPSTRIGVIIGEGTNATYLEHQDNVQNCNTPKKGFGKVIINTTWASFGDNGLLNFIRTNYDREIDSHDANPGFHLFEKMTSSCYLGEIVRLVMRNFINQNILLSGRNFESIFKKNTFPMSYITEIESDPVGTYTNCLNVLEKLGIKNANAQDCANVRYICECVSKRSAHLISATLAVLINKVNESRITVGIDGALYRYHPHYHNVLRKKTKELVDPKISFDIRLSYDGPGLGAALVAAVATRTSQRNASVER